MKSNRMFAIALSVLGTTAVLSLGQAPAPAPLRTGPGVQASQDAKEADLLATCKTPAPPARGGRGPGGAAGRGRGPAAPTGPKEYTVTEIPGVIASGQKWKDIWQVSGNNADGIIGTRDGGLLIAQNDNSNVMKLDKNGKVSVAYSGTNTGGAVSMNTKGVLFLNNRGLNEEIVELAPQRKTFANKYLGDPLDCIRTGVLNDLTADSKGGAYFTFGGLYYADPKGVVTKYGENLNTNGIILSRDEKTLYVTNGPTLAAFDVQPDGSLTNQREFAKWESGGGDGSTIDAEGRIYVSTTPGVQVISPEGKFLGLIPTPQNIISLAFSGKDKKTLFAVVSLRDANGQSARIISIPMIAQGYKGRAK
jgi:sugar lactone lactonase YvrE